MIGAVIFVIAFLGFLALTIGMPTLPPGSMIHDLLGIPQTDTPVLGIPTWQLINAIVNGVVYGFLIWLVYSLISRAISPRKTPVRQPVPEQVPYTVQPTSPYEEPTISKEATRGIKIVTLEGIGPTYAQKLEEANITTTDELLIAGATRTGRRELAEQTGISGTLILKWVNLADLLRIKGVGEEYSDLLEEAGVDTVVELARRNPENLHTKMQEVNDEKQLVRRLPSLTEVTEWIEQAKALSRKIEY